MAYPAAVFVAERVVVGPVDQAAAIIPFIDAAKADAVAEADRHAARHVEVVRNQQRLPARHLHDETLVPGAVVIVGNQARDDGTIVISTRRLSCRPSGVSLVATGIDSPRPIVMKRCAEMLRDVK